MVSVLHMDIGAAKSQLMRSQHFAEILGQLIIGSRVRGTDNGAAIAPGEPVSRDGHAYVRLEKRLSLDSEIGPGAAIVGYLLNSRPCNGRPEGADGARTDQIGISNSERIDAVV